MKKNNKGFTLMELLIVIAIIVVLVAIAIPVFNAQLEKAREATDMANIRAAYAEVSANLIMDEADVSQTVKATQTKENWQVKSDATTVEIGGQQVKAVTSGSSWTVKGSDGAVTITPAA
jgi:prepilin-type N-terminal cleavage/methylation domain-containing protein